MSCGLPKPACVLMACLLAMAELPVLVLASREGDCRAAALRGYWRKKLGLPPLPAPAPLAPAPAAKPDGPQQYCPDPAVDFQEETDDHKGTVEWLESGWSIHGPHRVSSKASFDLRGGWVEFDMDLSNARGGVNTNLYVTFPHQPNCGIDCYCDSGPKGGCAELDFIENNGNCFAQTTWHTDPNGNNKAGGPYGSTNIGPKVHVRAEFTADGATLDVNVNGNHHSGPGLGGEMDAHGAVIYSSEWVGWVPGNCPGDGNLGLASFKVQNLKILGKVKQGPQPRLCSQHADTLYK